MVRKSRSLSNFDNALNGLIATTSTTVTRNSNGGSGTPTGSNPSTTPTTSPTNFAGNTSYSDLIKLLSALGSQNGSGLASLLGQMGLFGMQDMSGAQEADYNKQLLDNLFNVLSEQDARNFNIERLKEQRIYDSPTNQLARLMGAGISRDAAIQMLSGSGSGSGGALVQGQAAQMSDGIAATQSDLNRTQQGTAIAQTVFGGIQAVTGLVSLGFSIPQAIMQTKFLRNQNFLTGKQIQSYENAGNVFSILHKAGTGADAFKSAAAAANAVRDLATNGDADASAFVSSGSLDKFLADAPFSSNVISQLYGSENSARSLDAYVDNLRAQEHLQKTNEELLRNQITYYQDFIENLRADTQYKNDSAALQRAHAHMLGVQEDVMQSDIRVNNSVVRLNSAIAESYDLANNLEHAFQETKDATGKTGLDLYTDNRFLELQNTIGYLSRITNPEAYAKRAKAYLSSFDNMVATYELGTAFKQGALNYYTDSNEDSKDLFHLCAAAEESGLFDCVRTMIDAENAKPASLTSGNQYFSVSESRSLGSDAAKLLLNPENYKPKEPKKSKFEQFKHKWNNFVQGQNGE